MASTTIASMARCVAGGSAKRVPSKASKVAVPGSKLKGVTSERVAGSAIAGAVFWGIASCEPAVAVQQIAQIAEGDTRGLALLLPLVPAIAWVLFNILQPALNQINRMRSSRGLIAAAGLTLAGMAATPAAEAAEGDNRGQLLLIVVAPAILWVLYNILQPALNQINKMRSR